MVCDGEAVSCVVELAGVGKGEEEVCVAVGLIGVNFGTAGGSDDAGFVPFEAEEGVLAVHGPCGKPSTVP